MVVVLVAAALMGVVVVDSDDLLPPPPLTAAAAPVFRPEADGDFLGATNAFSATPPPPPTAAAAAAGVGVDVVAAEEGAADVIRLLALLPFGVGADDNDGGGAGCVSVGGASSGFNSCS